MIEIEEKEEFVIIFYKKDDGTEPAKEFLDGLDNKMRAKMIRTVELLRDYGYELREPYSKHLNDGIFELCIFLLRVGKLYLHTALSRKRRKHRSRK